MSCSAPHYRGLGLTALAVFSSLVFKAQGLPLPLPGCPLRAATGIPCPTCFLTRSALATLHGDLGEALELHLFGPPAVIALGWFGLRHGLMKKTLPLSIFRWRYLIVLLVALIAYWLVRLYQWSFLGQFPV